MHRIPVLNGLRGLAIIAVVFHHSFFPQIRYGLEGGRPLDPWLILASSGWLGVNLFFFLSGFVLYLPYAQGSRAFARGSGCAAFYRHRAQRLLPLYYLSTGLLLIFNTPLRLDEWALYRSVIDHLFVTFVFRPDTFFPAANWVLWSLGVEIWFSVLFPLLVMGIHRMGWRRVLPSVLLFALAVRIAGRLLFPNEARPAIQFISDSVAGRLDEFMIGMLGAHLYARRIAVSRPALQLIAGLAMLAAALTLWAFWYRGAFALSASALFNLPFDFGLLAVTNAVLNGCRPLARMLSLWPLQMAGLMCYSLYLWHGVVIAHYRPSALAPGTYPAYLAITIALSWATYRYVEFRAVSDWRRLLPERTPSRAAARAAPQPPRP